MAGGEVQVSTQKRLQLEFAQHISPDLVLLDLTLPQKDGKQMLQEMRADAELKAVPVVVRTGSDTKDTQFRTYVGYANAYIRKPLNPTDFTTILRSALNYWLHTAEPPPSPVDAISQTTQSLV